MPSQQGVLRSELSVFLDSVTGLGSKVEGQGQGSMLLGPTKDERP